jgi:very-short-patch-repair endonuclease
LPHGVIAQHLGVVLKWELQLLEWYVCLKALPVTINRQKIIGNYIVDFYCASAKLVIEIDGSQHYGAKGIEQDNRRDEYLRSLGLTVKRYSNIDINQRFEFVSQEIYQIIFGKGEQGF